MKNNKGPIIWQRKDCCNRLLFVRVRMQQNTIAFLKMLEYSKPFASKDIELMRVLSDVLALWIMRNKYGYFLPETPEEFIFYTLISEKSSPAIASDWRIQQFTWNLQDDLYIITILLVSPNDAEDRIYYFKKPIQQLLQKRNIIVYKGNLVILVDRKKDQPCIPNSIREDFYKYLSENNLYAGISRRFNSINETSKFYIQAEKALELGMNLHSSEHLFSYDHYFIQHVFDLISKSGDPNDFCSSIIFNMMDYDKKKNTCHTQSLNIYLQQCQNIQKAADLLHVHINTLRYRIQKIQEIFGIDLENYEIVFELSFSLLLLQSKGFDLS